MSHQHGYSLHHRFHDCAHHHTQPDIGMILMFAFGSARGTPRPQA